MALAFAVQMVGCVSGSGSAGGGSPDMDLGTVPDIDPSFSPSPQADEGTAAICTPGSSFCNGTTLYACAADGLQSDSTKETDCIGGSTTNPATCSIDGTNCNGSAIGHGCCATTYPTCYIDNDLPWRIAVGTYELAGQTFTGAWCHSSTTQNTIAFVVYDGAGNSGSISFPTSLKQGVAQGAGWTASTSGSPSCGIWSGSITWLNDMQWPWWHVSYNLTCGASSFVGDALGRI